MRTPLRAIATLALLLLLAPRAALADPLTDASCWPKDLRPLCDEFRGHFEPAPKDCGSEWFHCYPGQRIPIKVALFGHRDVADLREYVALTYRYGISVAAILATVIIMGAGIVWMTSGGVDRLGTAKQWIGNAVIGLVLILGAYLILSTVNPDLVRLSLPRFAILRPIGAAAQQFCSSVSPDVALTTRDGKPVAAEGRGRLSCGYAFRLETGGECAGDACAAQEVCVPYSATTYRCLPAAVGGEVTGDGDAFLSGAPALNAVCADGRRLSLGIASVTQVVERRRHRFAFTKRPGTIGEVERLCGATGTTLGGTVASPLIRGFYLSVPVDATGIDDWYAIGGRSCGGSSKPIVVGGATDPGTADWSTVNPGDLLGQVAIFQAIEGRGASFRCSVGLTRSEFPDR